MNSGVKISPSFSLCVLSCICVCFRRFSSYNRIETPL